MEKRIQMPKERNEDLKAWAVEQVKKYAVRPGTVPCIVYWETKTTKQEIKSGLVKEGCMTAYHAYDYTAGKHHYLTQPCDPYISDGNGRSEEFKTLFGEKALLFAPRKSSYKVISKLNILPIDDGAMMIQVISFSPRKPFKKEYGVKEWPGNRYCDHICIVTQNKEVIYIEDLDTADRYASTSYGIYVVGNEHILDNKFVVPQLEALDYGDQTVGAFGETYEQMIDKCYRGNIRRSNAIQGTSIADINCMFWLKEFLCYKEVMVRPHTKRQKLVDNIGASLPKLDKMSFDTLSEDTGNHYYVKTSAYITKTDSDEVVIRYVGSDNSELLRLFITQDGFCGAKKTFYGEWATVNASDKASNWNANNFYIQKGIFDRPFKNIIYYVKDYLNSSDKVGKLIYSLLRYPILESAIKIGLQITDGVYYSENCMDELTRRVGSVKDNEKNINKALGLNSYQIEYLVNNPESLLVKNLKDVLLGNTRGYYYAGNNNDSFLSIADMDNNTFDRLIHMIAYFTSIDPGVYGYNYRPIEKVSSASYNVVGIMAKIKKIYSLDTLLSDGVYDTMNIVFNKQREIAQMFEKGNYNYAERMEFGNMVDLYDDYLKMAEIINDHNIAPAKMSSVEELRDAHNSLIVLTNNMKHEHEAAKFNELKSGWEKYVEVGDKYSIIYPDSPGAIVAEGRSLHHCVASFVNSVTDGFTNILFLRSNDDLEKSLVTIEVMNGSVRQAHGFANCTLASLEDSYPGINEFFNDWAKNKKLSAKNINGLLCAAR